MSCTTKYSCLFQTLALRTTRYKRVILNSLGVASKLKLTLFWLKYFYFHCIFIKLISWLRICILVYSDVLGYHSMISILLLSIHTYTSHSSSSSLFSVVCLGNSINSKLLWRLLKKTHRSIKGLRIILHLLDLLLTSSLFSSCVIYLPTLSLSTNTELLPCG